MSFAFSMLVALGLDMLFGWPDALFRRVGHPVTWVGAIVGRLEASLNQRNETRTNRARGVGTVLIVVGLSVAVGLAVFAALPGGIAGSVLAGVLAWPLIAARSLAEHVERVASPLVRGDSEAARTAVAQIVGRDPSALDEGGIARAATESLAENASDGVIAPLFWGAVAGLPGLFAYKAINTLDSMIGYRSERFLGFGWAAARLDDMATLIPARLTAFLFAAGSGAPGRALRIVRADARKHRSPNAGWPEAALAGALDIRLSGPRIYDGKERKEPWVHEAGRDPEAADILDALRLFWRVVGLAAFILLLASVAGL